MGLLDKLLGNKDIIKQAEALIGNANVMEILKSLTGNKDFMSKLADAKSENGYIHTSSRYPTCVQDANIQKKIEVASIFYRLTARY